MLIKQISIFVENKFGRLASIVDALSENHINISALSIADTTNYGILRLIVDKPDDALAVLKEIGVIAKCTDVIAVALEDKPGGLSKILKILTESEFTIEYMYAFVARKSGKALMVVKTDDTQKAIQVLQSENVEVCSFDDID